MFINLDFLGLKTTLQFAQAVDISSIGFYQGRFNALYIFQQLQASPLFGIGTNVYLETYSGIQGLHGPAILISYYLLGLYSFVF